jgi:hypothetical protein
VDTPDADSRSGRNLKESQTNLADRGYGEFGAPGRIIRWRKRRFVVVDSTGFEAIIARSYDEYHIK